MLDMMCPVCEQHPLDAEGNCAGCLYRTGDHGTREWEIEQATKAVIAEATALLEKHGPMEAELAPIQFHVRRAMHTLDVAFYTYPPDAARILDRLEHLAAVCVRAAVAVRGLPSTPEEDR